MMRNNIISNLAKLNKVFVHGTEIEYTYYDLYSVVKKLNSYFIKGGIQKVLVSLPQGFMAYASIIACYVSNVVFCSVHSEDPISRKHLYSSEFKPELVIADNAEGYDTLTDIIILTSEGINSIEIEPSYEIQIRGGNELAYVIYTSGSTGLPKGVRIKADAFSKEILWICSYFGVTQEDICSQYPKLNFDMSLIDIFVATVSGASLVPFQSFSDKLFPAKIIKQKQITFWNSVPNVIDLLATQNKMSSDFLGSIKKYKFGGEQIYASQLKKIFECNPKAEIFLSYGPSEVTLFCACCHVNKDNYLNCSKHNMSLGDCIPGWNICICDEQDGVGEIVVYGDYIGAGYIGNRNENSNFRTIMLEGKEYRAYFTGDFGTYIDGKLYFCGRRDSQVKVNGNRVDMSEIERVLRINGCDATCTVFCKGKVYLFYISEHLSEDEVRRILKKELPKSFFPHVICRKDFFPRNNSFKVDREELMKSI